MEYYRSPQPARPGAPAPPPPPGSVPRSRPNRRKWRALVWFSVGIGALLLVLCLVRFLPWRDWLSPLERFFPSYGESHFSFETPDVPDGFFDRYDEPYSPQSSGTGATTIPRADANPELRMELKDKGAELSLQEIYTKTLPSIVGIEGQSGSAYYSGTGVILSSDGYIVTNRHIIDGCSAASVTLSDGTEYEALLVGSDKASDLAVLKIDRDGLVPAEFGDSNQLRVGDAAVAIGNPLSAELFGTMTDGIISAINRDVNMDGYTMSLIQTTAALNPGNSGGALLNSAGQVVGITNMKMMSDYETIEGLGFAIPTVSVKAVVDELLAEGKVLGRPTIGVTCQAIPEGGAEIYGREWGVYVVSVTEGGPAEKAGLLSGDVIVEANGSPIKTLEDLIAVRDEAGIGGRLYLTVWRSGEQLHRTLTLVDQYELEE